MVYLNAACKQSFDPIAAACFTDLSVADVNRPSFLQLGIPVLDQFMCFITEFFRTAMATQGGLLVLRELLGMATAAWCLVVIESIRSTAAGFVRQAMLFGILSQLIGISVVFPFWLSSYWLANRHKLRDGTVEPSTIGTVATGLLLLSASVVAVCAALPAKLGEVVVFAFNCIPALAAAFAHLPPAFATPLISDCAIIRSQGSRPSTWISVSILYSMIAGICFTIHLWGRVAYLQDIDTQQLWGMFMNTSVELQCAYFLVVDMVVLFAWLGAFISTEFGLLAVVGFLLASVAFGPGVAFCFYMIQREQRLAQGPAATIAMHDLPRNKDE